MANKFLVAAGGNWTADTSWSTTDGGANDTVKPTASDDVFLTSNSGQCTISAASVGKSLTCTGYTNTLTHNAFTLTISGSITLVSGMTYTPLATSTLVIAATGTLTTGGKLIPLLSHTGGTLTLGDNLSFMASKVITMTLGGAGFDMNGKTINGNSATNRILIKSGTLGTAATITNATTSFTNADFRDITADGAINISAVTGLSGDCGGNTNITFTTSASQQWAGTTSDNWSTNAWTSRVPLPQDDVTFVTAFSGGQTVTADMPRMGRSIVWSGVSGNPSFALPSSSSSTLYGSFTLASMTLSQSSTNTLVFEGRGNYTITRNAKTFGGSITIAAVGGKVTAQDAQSFTSTFTLTAGEFDTNQQSLTIGFSFVSTGTTNTRTLTATNSTITLNPSSTSTVWNVASSNLTLNMTGSTINITGSTTATKTFAGAGMTYGSLTKAGTSADTLDITGNNTFDVFTVDSTSAIKTVRFTAATTTTFLSNPVLTGNATFGIVISSITAATHTLSKSSGTVSGDYLTITNSIASGGAGWYAGTHSTDGTGNTGWIFTDPPSGGGVAVNYRKCRISIGTGI